MLSGQRLGVDSGSTPSRMPGMNSKASRLTNCRRQLGHLRLRICLFVHDFQLHNTESRHATIAMAQLRSSNSCASERKASRISIVDIRAVDSLNGSSL